MAGKKQTKKDLIHGPAIVFAGKPEPYQTSKGWFVRPVFECFDKDGKPPDPTWFVTISLDGDDFEPTETNQATGAVSKEIGPLAVGTHAIWALAVDGRLNPYNSRVMTIKVPFEKEEKPQGPSHEVWVKTDVVKTGEHARRVIFQVCSTKGNKPVSGRQVRVNDSTKRRVALTKPTDDNGVSTYSCNLAVDERRHLVYEVVGTDREGWVNVYYDM